MSDSTTTVRLDRERLDSITRSAVADVKRGVPVETVKALYRPQIRECITSIRD